MDESAYQEHTEVVPLQKEEASISKTSQINENKTIAVTKTVVD